MCCFELVYWVVYEIGVLVMGLFEYVSFISDVGLLYLCLCQTHVVVYYVSVGYTTVLLCYCLVVNVLYVSAMLSSLN